MQMLLLTTDHRPLTTGGIMSTEVVMPQMGESIAEGTVTKWMKKVGDRVQRDEPLFEISTDKVDAEIPAPASGVLKEIRVEPGATVPINTVVAIIGEGDVAAATPAPPTVTAVPGSAPTGSCPARPPTPPSAPAAAPSPAMPPPAPPAPAAQTASATAATEKPKAEMTPDELRQTRSSPVVRKIAAEHNVDIRQVPG